MFIVLCEEKEDQKVCFTRVLCHLGTIKYLEYEFKGIDCQTGKIITIKSMTNAYFVTIYDRLPMGKFKFPEKWF